MEVLTSDKRTPAMVRITASLLAIILFCSFSFQDRKTILNSGREVFEFNCAKCHGSDGTRGRWGAKNLQASKLSDSDMRTIITKGKRIMPAWGKRLSENEILMVIDYVRNLRKA